MSSRADSPYSRLNYRRLIAWTARIEREWPFLSSLLADSPRPSAIDLGCGTGEHARHIASEGFRAVGVDRSEEQIDSARDFQNEFGSIGPEFILADLAEMSRLIDERFGLALCLGNVLPHLDDAELERVLAETAEVLLPGGTLLIQLLNYERIFAHGIRHLPVNFRDDPSEHGEDGEIVFLRLLRQDESEGGRYIWFYPSTLSLRPGEDPPIKLESAKEVRLRAWRRADLEVLLGQHGFTVLEFHGDMTGGPYESGSSSDLVVVAVKEPS